MLVQRCEGVGGGAGIQGTVGEADAESSDGVRVGGEPRHSEHEGEPDTPPQQRQAAGEVGFRRNQFTRRLSRQGEGEVQLQVQSPNWSSSACGSMATSSPPS